MMARACHVEIDPKKPRESRLAVAYNLDGQGKVPEAIEAMSGIPLHEYDSMELFVLSFNRQSSSPESFYDGFAPVDY